MKSNGTTATHSEFLVVTRCSGNYSRIVNKPGLFCAEPNSPPVFVVVPNADVPNPPVVPKPVSVNTSSDQHPMGIFIIVSSLVTIDVTFVNNCTG